MVTAIIIFFLQFPHINGNDKIFFYKEEEQILFSDALREAGHYVAGSCGKDSVLFRVSRVRNPGTLSPEQKIIVYMHKPGPTNSDVYLISVRKTFLWRKQTNNYPSSQRANNYCNNNTLWSACLRSKIR